MPSARFDGMFSGAEPFAAAPDLVAQVKPYFTRLNDKIGFDLGFGTAYQVGPAYFLKLKNFTKDLSDLNAANDEQVKACMEKLWAIHLKPLLQEYLKVNSDTDLTLDDLEQAYYGTNSRLEVSAAAPAAHNALLDDFSALAEVPAAVQDEGDVQHDAAVPRTNHGVESAQPIKLSAEEKLKFQQLLEYFVGVR